ncbi:MAG: hypothetical protein ACLQO7_10510 [Candidatus Bathyarchaeia archaeon]
MTSATVQADNGSPIYVTANPTPGYHFASMNDTEPYDAMWGVNSVEVDQS